MKFKAKFSRHFVECGEVEIEADNIEDAREIASTMLSNDEWEINWDSGSLEDESVESVEEL